MATEGHVISAMIGENVGSFQYPNASVEFSQFFKIFQRADRSGNHILNLDMRAGYTGDDTPIFEKYYAGGFSSIRGTFRGVTPRDPAHRHGRRRRLPIAGHGAVPVPDYGRRHAQGRGLRRCGHGRADDHELEPTSPRSARPWPADLDPPMRPKQPIALDFAFPINPQPGDQQQIFSFFVGFNH